MFTGVPGVSETFIDAFNAIKASTAYNSPLINRLFTGNAANNAGTASFRSLNSAAISSGSIATAALFASQRLCQAADVTNGILSCRRSATDFANSRKSFCVSALHPVHWRP